MDENPRYVDPNHYQSKLDDKSDYDHFLLSEDSRTFFGLYLKSWFFVCNTLPFGWSPSAYVYHTSGLGPTHFIRSQGVHSSNTLMTAMWDSLGFASLHLGQILSWLVLVYIYMAALVLVSCGYFIGLSKLILIPVQQIVFLGFIDSRTFFGLYLKSWFFVCNTLPFGWSPSAYVYHTSGLGPTHFIRSQGVHSSNTLMTAMWDSLGFASLHLGQILSWLVLVYIYMAALVLVSCGYFIGLSKLILIPVQQIVFLGFISDSVKQTFILLEEKKLKFSMLRDSILSSNLIAVKTLQRFVGKAISFSLAVPAIRFFTREVNHHIGKALKTSKAVRITEALRKELEQWVFLDDWDGFLPWKDEHHLVVKIISDSSNSGWGSSLCLMISTRQRTTGIKKTSAFQASLSGRQKPFTKHYQPFQRRFTIVGSLLM